jgi:amino acid transporter
MTKPPPTNRIGLLAAISIGVGGMIGAGIFSILGVVAGVSGSAMPLSFVIGGVVAAFAAYSYVKLGSTFPSVGGAVTFMVQGYGDGIPAGSLNVFQYFSYIIAIALYAHGFAGYATAFVDIDPKIWAVGVVVAFTLINFLGSRVMGRAETIIVAVKVGILIVFIVAAMATLKEPGRLAPATWPSTLDIFSGAGILFVGYEGFGLITNAAGNMAEPSKELPRAVYGSVAIVIVVYVLVASGVITNLPLAELEGLGDSALADAAKPALGQTGFTLIALAALLSTASAVNATLFGSTNVAYQIGKNGGLPDAFDRKLWGRDVEGLFITAGLVIVFVLLFPLSAVAQMGSAAFLLVYSAVNIGHLRIRSKTGAKAWLIVISVVTCLALFVALAVNMIRTDPSSMIALVATLVISVTIEAVYRTTTRRTFHAAISATTGEGSV